MRRLSLLVVIPIVALLVGTVSASAQSAALSAQLQQFKSVYASGNYKAGLAQARQLEALAKTEFGPNHANYAVVLMNLALTHRALRNLDESVRVYQRAIAIMQKDIGLDHERGALALNDLARVYASQEKYDEAAKLYKQALKIRENHLGAKHPSVAETAKNISEIAFVYYKQKKYAAASDLSQTILPVQERFYGANHLELAKTLTLASNIHAIEGRYSEAEKMLLRALPIAEKAPGADGANAANIFQNLAFVYSSQGRHGDAEKAYMRAASLYAKARGAESPEVVFMLSELAESFRQQGKYREAEEVYKLTLRKEEKAYRPNHERLARILNGFALVLGELRKATEAEAAFQRALAIYEKTKGPNHPDVAGVLNNLANTYHRRGNYAEAERLHQRALTIQENALGPNHPEVAATLNDLANVYGAQGRKSDAEHLYQRAMTLSKKAAGDDDLELAGQTLNLARVRLSEGRHDEAAEIVLRVLAMQEKKLGADHPKVATTLNILSSVYRDQRKYSEAAAMLKRAFTIWQRSHGADHPNVAGILNNLGIILDRLGQSAEAVQFYESALRIQTKVLAETHPDVVVSLHNLSLSYTDSGKPQDALAAARKASAAIIARRAAEIAGNQHSAGNLSVSDTDVFINHVASVGALKIEFEQAGPLSAESFQMAQRASQSSAGAALQQMGLRFASGNGALAVLVREKQDQEVLWREKGKQLLAELTKPDGQQNRAGIEALRRQIAEIDGQLSAIAARLSKEFPSYAALANPEPLQNRDVHELLGPEEALVFFLSDVKQSYVFVFTRETSSWHTISVGAKALSDQVAAFRRGLDVDAVNRATEIAGKPDLFDLGKAHALYETLFGPVEATIKGKSHLLVVPSGALTALPFHLLVTEKPSISLPPVTQKLSPEHLAAYGKATWLLKRHAVTVLPTVGSLKTIRVLAGKERGSKPMIGFGDPVFGPEQPAAPSRQVGSPKVAGVMAPQAPAAGNNQKAKVATKTRAYTEYWTGAGVDRAKLAQSLPRLADTADELRAVAKNLDAPAGDILLRGAATEAAVKQAKLVDYRVVYFATHGLVAGDVKGLAEPSLALTLPKQSSELDDGLLTASEVAQLKLNADWVVLSACNTIAGGAPGAEALSGLARSFFYAGARALLVSHWAVESDAATRLTTSAFNLLKADPTLGRSEAMRRAMLAYMADTKNPRNAYPAFWGPFAVIGEGAVQ